MKAEIRAAKKMPPVYDPECPPSTPDALREFAMLAAERNRRNRKQAVTIRLVSDCLEKYKALERGYTGIMADVLNYVADNPEILSKVHN
ncbi:MAG: BrnA antitoxin family protein [Treponema sp.]|jgi:uncharacterized protein (DUF4415 family)|nr:BrnA antitoxin family protein [Treponema sp.]